MSIPVSRSKIIIPRLRPDLLSRQRLLAQLDNVLDYRFTLISAPAGYGKTSLLIDLAHQVDYPVVWLSLDPLDQDLRRFLTYLIAALSLKYPDFGSRSRSLINNTSSPSLDLDQLIRTIVGDLYENISEHIVIILDDYHLVDDNQQISQFLSQFGQEMDENCHLIITSRSLINLPDMALLVGRSMVKGLGFEDLAFQANEIKALFEENYQQSITDQESQTLAIEMEGWITGLLLSLETGPHSISNQSKSIKVTGINLFDYFAEQVLNHQPPDLQDFMLRSSFLEEFHAQYCRKVLGKPPKGTSWSELINRVLTKNLFVQPVDDDSTWLRYHHLFRDFLQFRYKRDYPSEEIALLFRLLDVYTKSNSWEKAFGITQRLDDPPVMAEVIDQASSPLFHSGRINLLAAWLKILPESGFEHRPVLFALRGVTTTMLGDPLLGLSQLHYAVKHPLVYSFQDKLAKAYTWRAATYRLLGRYSEALSDGHKALNLIQNSKSKTLLSAETNREIGLVFRRLGDTKKSQKHLQNSLGIYRSLTDEKNGALVQMDLGVLYMNQGNLQEANQQFQRALRIWQKLENLDQQAALMNNLGILAHLLGGFVQAREWFESATNRAHQTSNLRVTAYTNTSLGDLALDLNHIDAAVSYYSEAQQLADSINDGFLLFYLNLCFSVITRKSGNYSQAGRHLKTAQDLIYQSSSPYELGLWHLEHGRYQLDLGEIDPARDDFLQAVAIFKETGKPVQLAQSHASLALVAFKAEDFVTASKQLILAAKTLQPLGTLQPLFSLFHDSTELLLVVQNQAHLEPSLRELKHHVNDFISRVTTLQQVIFPEVKSGDQTPYLLDIQALGNLQVLYKGEIISLPEWTQQRTVRELFFYMLSISDGASKDQIGCIFWPESSTAQRNQQFKNTIYRLRRSVGQETILYDPNSHRYHINPQLKIRYDVAEFLALTQQAESEDNPEKRTTLLRKVVKLYRHPYAPILDGVWTEPIRRNLYLKFERAALEIAEIDLQRGNIQTCLETCRLVVGYEPGQERAWRICMRAFAEQGDRTGITRVYRQCRKNLNRYLGVQPSPETESLYRILIN